MKHLEAENWSRQAGPLHGFDARAKLSAAVITLAFIGTARPWTARQTVCYAGLALLAVAISRLPWIGLVRRLALLLPFPATFAALSWISNGDATHAGALLSRSLISATIAVLLTGITTVPALLEGAAGMGMPRVLISVAQYLYRYLFVLAEQAVRMRNAAACRGGFRWSAAAGAAAALFASSEGRAVRIHHAMLARGYEGRDHTLSPPAWRSGDTMLVGLTLAALLAARILWQL